MGYTDEERLEAAVVEIRSRLQSRYKNLGYEVWLTKEEKAAFEMRGFEKNAIERKFELAVNAYDAAVAQLKTAANDLKGQNAPDPNTRKENLERVKAMVEGLPAVAAGMRDAIVGFEDGDPFAGSAGIMDICASPASMLASMSATAGPPGALAASLFSIVSMILKAFVKEKTSLSEQLDTALRSIDAEHKFQELLTAKDAMRSFINTVTAPNTTWNLEEYQRLLNVVEGPTINTIRNAAHWLNEPKNRDNKLWGDVLACQCDAYCLFAYCGAIAAARLSASPEDQLKGMAKVDAMFRANDPAQLTFLRNIKPAARQRGAVWHIGTWRSDAGQLYVRDTPRGGWRGFGGEQRVFTVTQRAGTSSADPSPYLAIFCLEMADEERAHPSPTYRNRKNRRAYGLFGRWPLNERDGWHEIEGLEGCTDICATPGMNEGEVLIYAARNGEIERWCHSAGRKPLATNSKFNYRDPCYNFLRSFKADSVCAVSSPRLVAPHSGLLPPYERFILYAGAEVPPPSMTRYIWANFDRGPAGMFPTPWRDAAIKVDRTYLWAFTRSAIACVTHYQAKRALQTKTDPPWMRYELPEELGGRWSTPGAFDGIHDLAPCDDGTLVAAIFDKRRPYIYHATPTIDLERGTLVIQGSQKDNFGKVVQTNGWVQANEGEAHRVHKDPLFCYPLVDGLELSLNRAVSSRRALGV